MDLSFSELRFMENEVFHQFCCHGCGMPMGKEQHSPMYCDVCKQLRDIEMREAGRKRAERFF